MVGKINAHQTYPLNVLNLGFEMFGKQMVSANSPTGNHKGQWGRDGILRERREHARGRNLAECGRICGSPRESTMWIVTVDKKYNLKLQCKTFYYAEKTA